MYNNGSEWQLADGGDGAQWHEGAEADEDACGGTEADGMLPLFDDADPYPAGGRGKGRGKGANRGRGRGRMTGTGTGPSGSCRRELENLSVFDNGGLSPALTLEFLHPNAVVSRRLRESALGFVIPSRRPGATAWLHTVRICNLEDYAGTILIVARTDTQHHTERFSKCHQCRKMEAEMQKNKTHLAPIDLLGGRRLHPAPKWILTEGGAAAFGRARRLTRHGLYLAVAVPEENRKFLKILSVHLDAECARTTSATINNPGTCCLLVSKRELAADTYRCKCSAQECVGGSGTVTPPPGPYLNFGETALGGGAGGPSRGRRFIQDEPVIGAWDAPFPPPPVPHARIPVGLSRTEPVRRTQPRGRVEWPVGGAAANGGAVSVVTTQPARQWPWGMGGSTEPQWESSPSPQDDAEGGVLPREGGQETGDDHHESGAALEGEGDRRFVPAPHSRKPGDVSASAWDRFPVSRTKSAPVPPRKPKRAFGEGGEDSGEEYGFGANPHDDRAGDDEDDDVVDTSNTRQFMLPPPPPRRGPPSRPFQATPKRGRPRTVFPAIEDVQRAPPTASGWGWEDSEPVAALNPGWLLGKKKHARDLAASPNRGAPSSPLQGWGGIRLEASPENLGLDMEEEAETKVETMVETTPHSPYLDDPSSFGAVGGGSIPASTIPGFGTELFGPDAIREFMAKALLATGAAAIAVVVLRQDQDHDVLHAQTENATISPWFNAIISCGTPPPNQTPLQIPVSTMTTTVATSSPLPTTGPVSE